MPDTLIDFLRHGEPVGGRCYRGNGVDDPLAETGWSQMWATLGDACPWDEIISSPLQRCHVFAQVLGERHGLPVRIDERFREVGFGSWEGRTPDQILADNADEYHAFHAGWYRTRIDNAGLTRFRLGTQGLRLEFHNRPSLPVTGD